MKKYFNELKKTMDWLSLQPNILFLGQAVGYAGTAMTTTLKDVPDSLKTEVPVCEEMQLGMSYGLALHGFVPVSIFPRLNFLLLSMNQLINHIDKYPLISDYKAKVIIRSGIGSERPLFPMHQHIGDFTEAIRSMCKTIKVVRLDEPNDIMPAYQEAYDSKHSTLLVEWSDYYAEK